MASIEAAMTILYRGAKITNLLFSSGEKKLKMFKKKFDFFSMAVLSMLGHFYHLFEPACAAEGGQIINLEF